MRILTENYSAYELDCACGARFEDDGRLGQVSCPECGVTEEALTLVEAWWSSAGWSVDQMVALAPAPHRAAAATAKSIADAPCNDAEKEKAA